VCRGASSEAGTEAEIVVAPRITVSPQVADALGCQFLAWQDAPFPDTFRCVVCRDVDALSRGPEVGLSVAEHPGNLQVVLHHLRCAPSQVVRSPGVLREDRSGPGDHVGSTRPSPPDVVCPTRRVLTEIPARATREGLFTAYLIEPDFLLLTSWPIDIDETRPSAPVSQTAPTGTIPAPTACRPFTAAQYGINVARTMTVRGCAIEDGLSRRGPFGPSRPAPLVSTTVCPGVSQSAGEPK
jgi:hypothetical protein